MAFVNLQNGSVTGSDGDDIQINDDSWVNAHDCETTNGSPNVGDTNLSNLNELTSDGVTFG